jgi:hypothetical protein
MRGFEDDVMILRTYNLIHPPANNEFFGMYRLVQLLIRKWLELQGELVKWETRYARILSLAFLEADYTNWSTCQAFLPHLEVLMTYKAGSESFRRDFATATYQSICHASERGKLALAEKMARASLKSRETPLDLRDKDTLDVLDFLALVLASQGRHEQAEVMYREVRVGREIVLGPEHSKAWQFWKETDEFLKRHETSITAELIIQIPE